LYVDVVNNNYPDFKTEIDATFLVYYGQTYEYKLPELEDKEGNDVPEVYVNRMVNQTYPPFLWFNNVTNTLVFRPDSEWYNGQKYYFTIVVKEKNSDVVMYPYYCTVEVNGTIIKPIDYYDKNYTRIKYEMTKIDRHSNASIVWSDPVNLEFVRDNWDAMFDVYVKNNTFREHN